MGIAIFGCHMWPRSFHPAKKNLPFPTKLQKRDAHSAIYLDPLSVIHPVVGGLWLCLPRLRKYLEEQCFTSSFEYSYILGGNSEGLGL